MQGFGERLAEAKARKGGPLAVGLDPHLKQLPAALQARYQGLSGPAFREAAAEAVLEFNIGVIDAVADVAVAVKPQLAFYEQLGAPGWATLEGTCAAAREAGLLVVADGKRGDISSTAAAYARALLSPDGPVAADCLTVNPWMGVDTLDPYLSLCREHGRGLFVLVRTTNPSSAALQKHGTPAAAEVVAGWIASANRSLGFSSGSIGAVVGAGLGEDARALREAMPDAWFLTPGVGAQGASAAQALAGVRPDGLGVLPVASRSILFPSATGAPEGADFRTGVRQRARALYDAVCAAAST